MKLIDILVEELPKRGGWDEKWHQCAQDGNGEVCFFTSGEIHFREIFDAWCIPPDSDCKARLEALLADDYSETIITREQYEAALAAKNEGWIEWGGGEYPPVSTNTVVDVKLHCGSVTVRRPAGAMNWQKNAPDEPGDIIAYRLHLMRGADLNECIGQDVDIPEWNGEGLPPVGVECEFKYATGEWVIVEITAIARNGVCFVERGKNGENYVSFRREFRPLRTEADKKREAAIKELTSVICGEIPDTGMATAAKYAARAFDAIDDGKIPGVKLEDL